MAKKKHNIREAVGTFKNLKTMQETIIELEEAGFDRSCISVLSNPKDMKKAFGKPYMEAKDLMDNPKTPRSANVAPEELGIALGIIISGGMIIGITAGAILSGGLLVSGVAAPMILGGIAGTVIGGIFARILDHKYDDFFDEQAKHGGIILWIRTLDKKKEQIASKILKNNHARNVHLHTIDAES